MTTLGSDPYAKNSSFWIRIIRDKLDRYRTELTDTAVLSTIGPVKARTVLDGGCGEGYMSRELANRGAIVTGLDTSSSLIAAAREERDRLGLRINHYVASLDSIPEDDETFDTVVCNHVINDTENPSAALKEISRVTKPGGRLILLMLHPCFYTAQAERSAAGNISVAAYFGTRKIAEQLNVAGLPSLDKFHMTFHPLEWYISATIENGYVITKISEPHPSPTQMEDEWWQQNFVKPLFMLIVAERVR
ncbi:MAG: class I SAM-dependent methyltransferase [Pseudonocardiaceae bacterium]